MQIHHHEHKDSTDHEISKGMGEKLSLANKGKEVTSVGMSDFILALSILYPENSYYKSFL